MSDALNRLNRISGYIELTAKVLIALTIIGMIFAFALMVVVILNPDILPEVSGITAATTEEAITLGVTIISGCVFGSITLYYLHRLFASIHKNNTPFVDENVKCLEMIAILVIAGSIAIPAISWATAYILDAGYELIMAFSPPLLFVAFLIYFVSLIFKYGTVLQKESDATL
ncbi:MAG: DUF2975 domain-containing protein [Candidatus Methanoplasma sp.]|jgi:hypothetical protein|nr:DUF2975 domain-containing protein [Candidatus Methanoplasma sp.]